MLSWFSNNFAINWSGGPFECWRREDDENDMFYGLLMTRRAFDFNFKFELSGSD